MAWLLLLFIGVPLIELYLLLWLGTVIGFWPTLAIAVCTGILGSTLAKREGLKVWREWRAALDEMRPPAFGLIESLLVLVGGVLLVTPGVLTDIAGLLLLVPPIRRRVAARVRRRVEARFTVTQLGPDLYRGGPAPRAPEDHVVDTTGEERDD